ncbi:MAG: cellulase family glycosylhydrolase [Planctomycetota bacterium]|nr:cellulase family glycosylhydrolase [Planctomycetota bacterium]
MQRKVHVPFLPIALLTAFCAAAWAAELAVPPSGLWTVERAQAWYEKQPWLVGCNFLPSTAVNDVEMWQQETFDPATIDRELGWAQDLGFNTVRVFINYVVWKADAEGLKNRVDRFLDMARRHGISTMIILLDDCFRQDPKVGRQPEPEPGVHNSQWVASPGKRMTGDAASWGDLERYVKDMVKAFARDPRVVAWDLYNEPSQSLPLVEAVFRWAREIGPDQPLTTCVYGGSCDTKRLAELSDVVSFHNYGGLSDMKKTVARLAAWRRPLLCTEWMARPNSRFESHLPFLKENKVGAWNWGLVAGRTQTYFPWGSPKNAPEPAVWFHDVFRKDGTPYNPREIRVIRETTGKLPPRKTVIVIPTAQQEAVVWRYATEAPADGWFKPGFDDAAWKTGPAPFGAEEPPIARHPRTVWKTADLWLRREFEIPAGAFEELALLMHHDEDTEVYIDGVLAAKVAGYNAAYEPFDLRPEARAVLMPGRHLMAVHVRQTVGGQYIDVGIEGVAKQ